MAGGERQVSGARWLVFAYGLIAYLLFLAVFAYAVAWLDDLPVPYTIDGGVEGSVLVAVVVDVALVALFGIQHTIMARQTFKRRLALVMPEAAERSTFVLAATLVLAAIMWFWRPLPWTLWQVESSALRWLILGVQGLGWIGVLASTFAIDHFDLFGIRQVYGHARGVPHRKPVFEEPWLYRQVRHPMMLALIVAFWASPDMSWGRALFALAMTGYVLIGVTYEERDLVRALGDDYRAYQRRVPRLFPNPFRSRR
jgi:protein-S-isoprenylcysteine O-methyltransferase Ste14